MVMTQTATEAIGPLRAVMEGPVIEPGDRASTTGAGCGTAGSTGVRW
jgi:hypothetical protein